MCPTIGRPVGGTGNTDFGSHSVINSPNTLVRSLRSWCLYLHMLRSLAEIRCCCDDGFDLKHELSPGLSASLHLERLNGGGGTSGEDTIGFASTWDHGTACLTWAIPSGKDRCEFEVTRGPGLLMRVPCGNGAVGIETRRTGGVGASNRYLPCADMTLLSLLTGKTIAALQR